jgi:hypothetical protein
LALQSFEPPDDVRSESPEPVDSEDWLELPAYARPASVVIDDVTPPVPQFSTPTEASMPSAAPAPSSTFPSVPAPAGPVGPSSPDGLFLGVTGAGRTSDDAPPQPMSTPKLQPAEPATRSQRLPDGETTVTTTASIPVIRPPVQVRRPDEDKAAATAETRSLRVTPPNAKALFSTPVGAKGADGRGVEGWPAPAPSAPEAVNVAPPTQALAPPHPVAPKTTVSGSPAPEDPEPGPTRQVVVIPGTASSTAGWAPSGPKPSAAAAPSAIAPPPVVVPAPMAGPPPVVAPPVVAPPVAAAPAAVTPAFSEPDLPPRLLAAPGTPPAWGNHPDPGMSEWLGELRGSDDAGQQPAFGFAAQTNLAQTVVPGRGREARQNRKAADRDKRSEERSAQRFQAAEPPDGDRGRWLSLLVFWAPAMILLLLAGVVIWLVR